MQYYDALLQTGSSGQGPATVNYAQAAADSVSRGPVFPGFIRSHEAGIASRKPLDTCEKILNSRVWRKPSRFHEICRYREKETSRSDWNAYGVD